MIDLLHHPESPAAQHKVWFSVILLPLSCSHRGRHPSFTGMSLPCVPLRFHSLPFLSRRAILPLPKLLTHYIDQLRKLRLHGTNNFVFVNTRGKAYEPGKCLVTLDISNCVSLGFFVALVCLHRSRYGVLAAWTAFVKSCFDGFSRQNRMPNGSLLRSIFVSWLNSLPFDKDGQDFLEELKLSAATYQTHSYVSVCWI